MVVQEFLVNTGITLQLCNPSPALGVRFLNSTAFDKMKGALEIYGRGTVVACISCQFTKHKLGNVCKL